MLREYIATGIQYQSGQIKKSVDLTTTYTVTSGEDYNVGFEYDPPESDYNEYRGFVLFNVEFGFPSTGYVTKVELFWNNVNVVNTPGYPNDWINSIYMVTGQGAPFNKAVELTVSNWNSGTKVVDVDWNTVPEDAWIDLTQSGVSLYQDPIGTGGIYRDFAKYVRIIMRDTSDGPTSGGGWTTLIDNTGSHNCLLKVTTSGF